MEEKIDVRSIASLAKLRLSDSEAERLEKEMLQFADYANVLDVSDNKSYSHVPIEKYGIADEVTEAHTDISQLANSVSDGYITVPLTVEGE